MNDYRLIICGSRSLTKLDYVDLALTIWQVRFPFPTRIISGVAPTGPDNSAAIYGEQHNIPVDKFPALWRIYGKPAGYIRNQQMIDKGKANGVLGIWDGISRGTHDMLKRGVDAGLNVAYWNPATPEAMTIIVRNITIQYEKVIVDTNTKTP